MRDPRMRRSRFSREFVVGQDVVMRSNPTAYGHVAGFDDDGSIMVQWAGTTVVTGVSPTNLKIVPQGWAGKRMEMRIS